MKRLFLLAFLFQSAQSINAQNHFAAERLYVNIPSSQTLTSAGIAGYINSHFTSPEKRIAAIYSWIVNNIRYDKDSLHYVILDEDNEERVAFALRRKRGVCENFAAIFSDVANQCGIKSFMVEGFTKQGGFVDRTGHAWCIAFINNNWGLYDPTWDAARVGSNTSESYFHFFNVAPEVFIESHLPFDPVYQLLNYPVNYNEFERGIIRQKNKENYFNYVDSLQAIEKMDRRTRYTRQEARIENAGWPLSKVETQLKRIRFQVEVLSQDNDADLYNSAVADYNAAIHSLNTFLIYRNNQFQPPQSNEAIEKIFQDVSISIASANLKLKKIDSSTATLQLNTTDIKKKLSDLEINLKKQESFFESNKIEASAENKKL